MTKEVTPPGYRFRKGQALAPANAFGPRSANRAPSQPDFLATRLCRAHGNCRMGALRRGMRECQLNLVHIRELSDYITLALDFLMYATIELYVS